MPPNKNVQTPRPPIDLTRARTLTARRRWEYTTFSSEQPIRSAQIDSYGADGWELVDVYVRMDAVHAVFKREVVG